MFLEHRDKSEPLALQGIEKHITFPQKLVIKGCGLYSFTGVVGFGVNLIARQSKVLSRGYPPPPSLTKGLNFLVKFLPVPVCSPEKGRRGKKGAGTLSEKIAKFIFHTTPFSGVKQISWEKKTSFRAVPREHFFSSFT